jgi:hypothetical protein
MMSAIVILLYWSVVKRDSRYLYIWHAEQYNLEPIGYLKSRKGWGLVFSNSCRN